MKIALLVLFVLVAAAHGACRNNCGSDELSSDANGRCYCDDTCEDADDCCSDYAAECGGQTDDTACQGCPDGAQTSTSGSARGSCYCDAACVDSGDCCPSYQKYCAGFGDTSRQAFCSALASSKSVFCDTAMRKAYKLEVVSKIDTSFGTKSGPGSEDWALDTYNRTCLLEPQIVEDEAVTCDTIRGFNWRYGCTGLNSVWAQLCDSSSCRDRDCDVPWRRDYWGATSRIALHMDPRGETDDPNHPEFPAGYGPGDEEGVASQAGRCLMSFTQKCVEGALPDDSDRAKAWVYGCLDTTYDAADVEFLDWETAVTSSPPWSGADSSSIDDYGNGDSIKSQFSQVDLTRGRELYGPDIFWAATQSISGPICPGYGYGCGPISAGPGKYPGPPGPRPQPSQGNWAEEDCSPVAQPPCPPPCELLCPGPNPGDFSDPILECATLAPTAAPTP